MKVAILCGGRGSRIREVNEVIPKPLLPIGEYPILWHIMKLYSAYGYKEFVLLLGYKSNLIRDYFLNFPEHTSDLTIDFRKSPRGEITLHNYRQEPWKITMVETGDNAMTGARIWRARKYLEGDGDFAVTYGDGVGDIDIEALREFHMKHGKVATVTGVQPPGRFGELKVTDHFVTAFNEKPQVSGGFISGGFFIFKESIFDKYLNPEESLVLEKAPLEKLSKDRQLKMFRHDGFWQPMDTPREFQLLNEVWADGSAPWKIWDAPELKKKTG